MDTWFERYKVFLSERDMLDKPHEICNADETGFTMGSKAGKGIGPYRSNYSHNIPHVSGESFKQRLTVMYCANAEGQLMVPLFRFPEHKPSAYDPLTNSTRGSKIAYTPKGWMNSETFFKFIDHFDENAGKEPVELLFDSVSSHINMEIFTKAMD